MHEVCSLNKPVQLFSFSVFQIYVFKGHLQSFVFNSVNNVFEIVLDAYRSEMKPTFFLFDKLYILDLKSEIP